MLKQLNSLDHSIRIVFRCLFHRFSQKNKKIEKNKKEMLYHQIESLKSVLDLFSFSFILKHDKKRAYVALPSDNSNNMLTINK